jgi:hypothetical protein
MYAFVDIASFYYGHECLLKLYIGAKLMKQLDQTIKWLS